MPGVHLLQKFPLVSSIKDGFIIYVVIPMKSSH